MNNPAIQRSVKGTPDKFKAKTPVKTPKKDIENRTESDSKIATPKVAKTPRTVSKPGTPKKNAVNTPQSISNIHFFKSFRQTCYDVKC
jgi:hypothetical protein